MNINKPSAPPIVNPYQKHNPVTKVEQVKKAPREDELQISNKARELYDMKTEQEREAKVTAIKKQIEEGTYRVDSQKTAEKLFDQWF
ncbi:MULTISPECIES: flagellar biosynthesis anti-sigma factor FlgM [Guptibacillus]|uniref:flagellar biosynthesis anti-sigma factor FlgM n=1 Tax=Guptibacillus TaxID=3421338 RepID=UPI001CD21AA3|nr:MULTISPECIES: flagellar biosynthesis anti-sigma factor FlgM [Pseudalkalibacillus]MCA0991127.1 flagellar biosynthesis anti-sigma factor FlgM [Pseudalkalibacillus hwajinpoensis]